jgi:hypothetical protein
VSDRIAGVVLFLPVPLVLVLFTRQPLGPWPSLGLGLVLVATHRLYARRFALSRAARRCLWCGARVNDGRVLVLQEPQGETRWRACGEPHRLSLSRTLGWASLHRRVLAVGILGTLGLFLAAAVSVAAGVTRRIDMGDTVAFFRLGVAATVLPLGWLAPTHGPGEGPRRLLPFPVHVQALVGTLWVVWLFRLVGLWWLASGLVHVTGRLR